MANSFHRHRFLVYALLMAFATATDSPSPPITVNHSNLRLQQLYNIIDALIGSGDFGNWANILSTTDPSMFPLSATLFVPGDTALHSFSDSLIVSSSSPDPPTIDPILFSYHIVPQRLTFSDLALFPVGSRLPTLLFDRSIIITNNSRSNFTLNKSHLTRPDMFSTPTVAVHGISEVLQDSTTNAEPDNTAAPPPQQVQSSMEQEKPNSAPVVQDIPTDILETPADADTIPSRASCHHSNVATVVFLPTIMWWLLALIKIPKNSTDQRASP